MRRMVKNGDLIDVEPDGTITVAGKPIGGGGGGSENDRVLRLIIPVASGTNIRNLHIPTTDDEWQKLKDYYYESVIIYYNDDVPLGVFNVLNIQDSTQNIDSKVYAAIVGSNPSYNGENDWFGSMNQNLNFALLRYTYSSTEKWAVIESFQQGRSISLDKKKFDDLYKLADKPTQDGTYVLKATVSGGAVTYTWELQQ